MVKSIYIASSVQIYAVNQTLATQQKETPAHPEQTT